MGSLTLKPAAFKDLYLPPVASEASGVLIHNTNQLHNTNKKLLNTNQQLFPVKKKEIILIFFSKATQ